jgi:DNA-binding XRE family transcriptional regulator
MTPFFRFFTRSIFIILLGIGVSSVLFLVMQLLIAPKPAISETFSKQLEPSSKLIENGNDGLSPTEKLLVNANAVQALEEKPVNLEENMAQKGLLVNIAPPQSKKTVLTRVKIDDLGKYIKKVRTQQHINISDLKAATGLTEQQILNIEAGKTVPTPDIAIGFENILQIDVKYY